MAKLVVAIDGEPREFPLGDRPITIGREPENEVQLDWPDVSRRHCRIEPLPQGGYRVLDLGSKNGTYLNGRQITAMALEFDDRVRLGDALIVYVDDETDPWDALRRGSDESFLPFSPGNTRRSSVLQSDETEGGEGTWRRRAGAASDRGSGSSSPGSSADIAPFGPGAGTGKTRASNRSYLKERLVRLGLLSQNIASELDLSRLMETILDEVLDFTGFERGLLLYGEEGRLKPVLGRNMDHEHLEDEERRFSKGLVEEALSARRIVFRTGIQGGESDFSARESVVSMGLDSALCIPLSAPLRLQARAGNEDRRKARRSRRVLGAIYLDSKGPIRQLDDADLRLLEAVAAQAAIALQNARLHYQASTDPLTNLSNRAFIKQIFEDELRQARESKDHVGVLLLDLDHFKRVNDSFGHDVGDEVLKRVAQRLRRTVRRDDYAGRWGGEEFVVVLPGEGVDGARIVGEKIAEAIRGRPFGEAEIVMTTSVGVAVYPEHGETMALLLKHADQALYAAKAQGRNRIVVFSPELDRIEHKADPVGGIFDADPAHTHRNLTAIFDTIDTLRSALSPQEVLERTLDNVCDLTRARRALLIVDDRMLEPREGATGQRVTVARGRGGRPLPAQQQEWAQGAVESAIKDHRSLCVLDAGDKGSQPLTTSSMDRLGLSTVMVVPLLVGGQALGALYADDTVSKREFSHMDLAHLEVMAHQLALSLAANPDLKAAAFGRNKDEMDETTRLRREVSRLRDEIKQLRETRGLGPAT